jgi:hypothetical protein
LVGASHGHVRAARARTNDHACSSVETRKHVFSRRAWHQRKYAEDPDYREKRLASARRYQQAHKHEIAELRRLRRETDPAFRERERSQGRKYRRKKIFETVYGISQEQYEARVARQGGLCAICNTKPEKALCIDHSHATGQVRGLLCSNCNSMLGFSKDDPRRLAAGAGYLRVFGNDPAISRQGKTSATSDPVVPANAGTQ